MASMSQFYELANKMKELSINIVMYDAYGCGISDKPHESSEYTTDRHLADLIEIYEKYATTRNILIGHSYGTSQIARLCKHLQSKSYESADTPIRSVDAVILMSTAFFLPDGGPPLFKLPLLILNRMNGFLSRQFISIAYSPATSEAIKKQSLELSMQNDMFVVKAFYQQFQWSKLSEWSSLLPYPLVIVQGADDKLTPASEAEKLVYELEKLKTRHSVSDASVFSTAQLMNPIKLEIVENCGHQVMIEKTDEVYDIIKQFLGKSNLLNDSILLNDVNAYWNQQNENSASSSDNK